MSLYTVDGVSAQTSCAIGPNLPTLTLNNGLGRFVELHCQCMDGNGMMIFGTRWFHNGNLVAGTFYISYTTGVPSRLLIRPRFTSSYDGTYTCSPNSTFPTGSSGDNITLIAGSEYLAIYCLFIM